MFICRQNINFVVHVFLEILQKYCELVFLGTLGMYGYAHPKWYYQFVQNFRVYLLIKNQLYPHVFLKILQRYCKLVILGTLGMLGYAHPKWYYQLVENVRLYMQAKNNFIRHLFLKIFQTCYFGYFRHAWLRTHKVILWTCRKLSCLSAGKKINFITHVFLEILRR